MPAGEGLLARLGAASLWPYVLHGLLLRAAPLGAWLQAVVPSLQLPAAVAAGLAAVLGPAAWLLRRSGTPPAMLGERSR